MKGFIHQPGSEGPTVKVGAPAASTAKGREEDKRFVYYFEFLNGATELCLSGKSTTWTL